ncbi:MAG: VWA-like domain-containing protein [Christensenellaceae bacterium]|jgi:predicted metal-dependent peptidase|nr:VWA-like domain-containing protein [Christensenellaceae bacterium]
MGRHGHRTKGDYPQNQIVEVLDIVGLKEKMLDRYPFLRGTTDGVPLFYCNYSTAFTDGKSVTYNGIWLSQLDEKTQLFVLTHEYLHIYFNHIPRMKGKNYLIWNMATDAIINKNLELDGLPIMEGMVNIDDALLYTAEELYDILNKNADRKEIGKMWNDECGDHTQWNGERGEQTVKKNGPSNSDENGSSNSDEKGALRRNRRYRNAEFNCDEPLGNEDGIKNEEFQFIGWGTHPGEAEYSAGEIKEIAPRVNWKALLQYYTESNDLDFDYENLEIDEGNILRQPLTKEYAGKPKSAIVIDSSGSVSNEFIKTFLSECLNVLKVSSEVHVGFCDVNFGGFTQIKTKNDVAKLKVTGRGGTNFSAMVDAFDAIRDIKNKIIFTDGYCDMPKRKENIIWIVYGDYSITPPGGVVIKYDKRM